MEAVNTKFKDIGLTRLENKPESTAPEADALATRPSEPRHSLHSTKRYTFQRISFCRCNLFFGHCLRSLFLFGVFLVVK